MSGGREHLFRQMVGADGATLVDAAATIEEGDRIRIVCRTRPDVILRVDATDGWTLTVSEVSR